MDEGFILEVDYKASRHELPAELQVLGYTHRFIVTLPEMDIWFERDEEGSYRALLPPDTCEKAALKLDKDFLQAIANQIEEVLK